MFLMYPHKKNSSGERSGLRGGQGIGPRLPTQSSRNLSFKTSVTKLSPLDFFLWGYIKNIVYAEKIRNIQHLQERITSAIETLKQNMIQKTWQEIEFRLDVSRATNGVHIELY
jgi:hypothetical protein